MRDYEFRGKLLNTNVWIYGNLRIHFVDGDLEQKNNRYFIEYNYMDKHGKVHRDSYEVDPSTIGQFTGLYDKNKVKIYEDDIIELEDRYVIVEWNKYLATYDLDFLRYKNRIDNGFIFKGVKMLELFRYKVIGNIHDKEDSINEIKH